MRTMKSWKHVNRLLAVLTAIAMLSFTTSAFAEEIVPEEVAIDSAEEAEETVGAEVPEEEIFAEGVAGWVAGETSTQKLEISDGLSTLTWKATGATKQLTPRLIAKDGGIASDGTVYILYDVTYSLWAYNYELQGANGNLVPIVTTQYPNSSGDTSVLSLTFANGVLTGYTATNAGTGTLFSKEEFKARAIASGNLEPDPVNPDNPDPVNPDNPDNPGKELEDPNKGNKSVSQVNAPKPGTIRVVDGKVIYTEDVNGVPTDTTIKIVGTLDSYGVDDYNTFAIRTTDEYLYHMNPEVSVTPYLYSKECTGLIIENDKVVGYKLKGGDVKVLELKVLTSLYLHQWRCVADSSKWFEKYIDPNGNQIVRTRHKWNSIRYYRQNAETGEWTKKVKKVGSIKQAGLGTDGTWFILKKNGRLYTVDQSTYKVTKYNKDELKKRKFKEFLYSANGTVIYAIDKKGDTYPLF